MLQSLNRMTGATVHALDGDVGSVDDFFFDDEKWVVRYVIVETGTWLTGRRVVLSVMSLLPPDWDQRRIPAKLAREQIRNSPDVLSHPEVSRALEEELLSFYGFPYYWAGDALWGPVSNPAIAAENAGRVAAPPPLSRDVETHLRSCSDLVGYAVHARDGSVGHVDDLLVDTTAWAIENLAVVLNGSGTRRAHVRPESVSRIDWAGRSLRLDLSHDTVLEAHE